MHSIRRFFGEAVRVSHPNDVYRLRGEDVWHYLVKATLLPWPEKMPPSFYASIGVARKARLFT